MRRPARLWSTALANVTRSFVEITGKGRSVKKNSGGRLGLRSQGLGQIAHNLFGRGTGSEHLAHTQAFQFRQVLIGNDPAPEEENVPRTLLLQGRGDLPEVVHVRTREDREAYGFHILLNSSVDDHLARLPEARVDDLHAGVTESAGYHLGTTVVTVQARLGYENAYRASFHLFLLRLPGPCWRSGFRAAAVPGQPIRSDQYRFLVDAVHLSQNVHLFTQGAVGVGRLQEGGHGVLAAHGGLAQRSQRTPGPFGVPLRADPGKTFGLDHLDFGVDRLEGHFRIGACILVDAHYNPFTAVYLTLLFEGGIAYLPGKVALLDGRLDATQCVNLLEVVEGLPLHLVGEALHEVGACQGIGGIRHSGFIGDDLLCAECQQRRFFARQRQGLVIGVRVQAVGAPKHTSQGL